MAGIQKIRQTLLSDSGSVLGYGPIVWTYVNTTVEEERYITKAALVPLGLLDAAGELTVDQSLELQRIFKTFFGQGYFLTGEHWNDLQKMLVANGYPELDLEDNGLYDQPLDAKNKKAMKPTPKSFKLNGKRRLREYDVEFDRQAQQQFREATDEIAAELALRDLSHVRAEKVWQAVANTAYR